MFIIIKDTILCPLYTYPHSYPQFSIITLLIIAFYRTNVFLWFLAQLKMFVRIGRIELPSYPWQGYILPLNHTRMNYIIVYEIHLATNCNDVYKRKLRI